jgi:hypothetical protein
LTACQDPYFQDVILKDELNFLDKTNTLMATSTMGLNKDFVVGGKVVGDTGKVGDGAEGVSPLETNGIQNYRISSHQYRANYISMKPLQKVRR